MLYFNSATEKELTRLELVEFFDNAILRIGANAIVTGLELVEFFDNAIFEA